jgi:putative endonuclease
MRSWLVKKDKIKIGQKGEEEARKYLKKKGLRLVAKNWRAKTGEIDLIMKDGEVLVFVEVRLRRKTQYGAGYEKVGRDKMRKLINTAQSYQVREDYWGDVRFDVVSIEMDEDGNMKLEHIKDAFGVERKF